MTFQTELEEIEKEIKEAEEDYYSFNTADKLRERKSQLIKDKEMVKGFIEKELKDINVIKDSLREENKDDLICYYQILGRQLELEELKEEMGI